MPRKNDAFLNDLNQRREKKEVQSGTIWLKSYEEYKQLAEAFNGKIVKPIHAAKMLGVSRANGISIRTGGQNQGLSTGFHG